MRTTTAATTTRIILSRSVASTGATVRLSSDATDARATGGGDLCTVNNGVLRRLRCPSLAGSTRFFAHVAAEDGYSTNIADVATAGGFQVRRDADVRVKEVTISWNGDKIVLDRDALNLDPDGETDPVTGTTTLRVTVDEGDGGDADA